MHKIMTLKITLGLFLALLLHLSFCSIASAAKLEYAAGENSQVQARSYTPEICPGVTGYNTGVHDFGLCTIEEVIVLSADDLHCALTVDGNSAGDCQVWPSEMLDEHWRRIKRYSWYHLPGVVTSTMRLVCTKK